MPNESQTRSKFERWVRAETGNERKIAGRRALPWTMEGRLALLAGVLCWLPLLAGILHIAAAVLLVLAVRKGDRGVLLIVPLLAVLFLVLFVVAEFTIGHD